jgi:hypothetical protein
MKPPITILLLAAVGACLVGGVAASSKTSNKPRTSTIISTSASTSTSTSTSTSASTVPASSAPPPPSPERPALVRECLEKKRDIYYFGLGSNMLRSKLENRSICGTKIQPKSFEPAVVPNYRLAFNMRGFPPLEPGMGSLEPLPTDDDESSSSSKALLQYDKPECHGSLVCLSADDYERVMRSEGVGNANNPNAGYEEVVVTAIPYDQRKRPVQAIALRARDHVRLSQDPAPSLRYMTILRQGAEELGLKECYRNFLNQHPVAQASPLLRKIAVCNLVGISTLSFRLKMRIFSKIQNWFLWKAYYVPPPASDTTKQLSKQLRLVLSELVTIVILFPGALFGYFLWIYMQRTNKMSPMMKSMVNSHW